MLRTVSIPGQGTKIQKSVLQFQKPKSSFCWNQFEWAFQLLEIKVYVYYVSV